MHLWHSKDRVTELIKIPKHLNKMRISLLPYHIMIWTLKISQRFNNILIHTGCLFHIL
jgi:hypothetical protein